MTQETVAAAATDAVLDREETISRDELEALQLSRLQHTVAYAYDRVPLYKRKFDDAGVHPTDLRELSDLGKFPFTTKEDLRLEYPFGMFAVPQHEVARIHASSGTTGRATVVGLHQEGPRRLGQAGGPLAARLRRPAGHEGPQRLRLRPVHRRPGRARRRRGARLHRHPDLRRPDRAPDPLIQDFKPDAILATPTYLLTIADAMVNRASTRPPPR